METIEEIEKNTLFWLMKAKKRKGLDKDEEHVLKTLCEKYPSFGFWAFNYHQGFFKGLPEYEQMENQLKT